MSRATSAEAGLVSAPECLSDASDHPPGGRDPSPLFTPVQGRCTGSARRSHGSREWRKSPAAEPHNESEIMSKRRFFLSQITAIVLASLLASCTPPDEPKKTESEPPPRPAGS